MVMIYFDFFKFKFIFPVTPASMWTKKEVAEFKDSIRNEGGDSIIKVN